MNPAQSSNPTRTAIMVLIALVAVAGLASMLLPSLAKAKAKARHASLRRVFDDQAFITSWPASPFHTESYEHISENPFLSPRDNPLSTFSIDVDTAAYSNLRRFLNDGQLPPPDSVRIEEMLNYFTYDYGPPAGDHPLAVHVEIGGCPWNTDHRLARIGLSGKVILPDKRPACNLVFLIDVSGSMEPPNKLPLLLNGLELLVQELSDRDRVAIVVYAGDSGLMLDSVSGADKRTIRAALRRLRAGGSTNGGAGIDLAYQIALQNFIPNGANRVILCTDGDFNVGLTSPGDLTRLIQRKARSGVFLTVLGFGMGNYKDGTLERLADLGNGNYGYIDSLFEAKKLLVDQLNGTLVTIAKDVKIQVEFNPARVHAYRLIGYENRLLRNEDFNDEEKDAGELGSGHTVTALYEIVPAGKSLPLARVDPLKYQPAVERPAVTSAETMSIKLRYKLPEATTSSRISVPVTDPGTPWADTTRDFKFAAAVAAYGMILRDSPHKGAATFDLAMRLATQGNDRSEYRQELLNLIEVTSRLMRGKESVAFTTGP